MILDEIIFIGVVFFDQSYLKVFENLIIWNWAAEHSSVKMLVPSCLLILNPFIDFFRCISDILVET